MSLGQQPLNLKDDIAVARRAMEAGIWFHSSPTYNMGFTYMILRMAFDEARSQRPPLVLKIRDAEPRLLRFEVEDALRRLDIDRIDIIQLVHDHGRTSTVLEGFLARDERWELVQSFKKQGKIGSAVLYLEPNRSPQWCDAMEQGLFDGVIFYNNLIEYHVPAGTENYVAQHPELPVLALRSVCGAAGMNGPDTDPVRAQKVERLQALARECGCSDLIELSMRFALHHAGVRTSIGGTKSLAHLERFLKLVAEAKPLSAEVAREIGRIRGSVGS